MHKPPRRMHTSTGQFPFSRRSPSKRRAFLGVFNITKSFGRHDKCQRPRISLQIKRCQPVTPPIIRRKHRELPIFLPEVGMQGPSIAEYSQKCTSPPPPHGAKQNKRATFLSGAFRRTQEALAARSAQRGLLACPRTFWEVAQTAPAILRELNPFRTCRGRYAQ